MKLIFILLALLSFCGQSKSQAIQPRWKTLPEAPPMPKADKNGIVSVNDIKIYYAIFSKKLKDPVILLHGGLVSSDEWGFEVPRLSKTHEVVIVDSRGHGRSTMSDQPLSYDLMASDVLQLMNILHIKKASIIGWSDGGIIGLLLAIHHPERINKLFTFGTNYNLQGYKSEPSDTSISARFMERAQENYRRISPTPDSFFVFLKALGTMYSTQPDIKAEKIRTIKAPTVIAGGEYEQFIKREHFEELANLIPSAKLVIIPGMSHGGPLQDPVAFHRAVANLLDRKQK